MLKKNSKTKKRRAFKAAYFDDNEERMNDIFDEMIEEEYDFIEDPGYTGKWSHE